LIAAARNPRRGIWAAIAFLLLAGIGVARVVATYKIFNQTTDEPAHLATGMEWLDRGTYSLEPLHPPLARVAIALGPYLSGIRLTGQGNVWAEGNEMLFARGRYLHNLALARLGVLPFFLLASFLVWCWSRRRYGEAPAFVAALLFTSSPVILAHAGVATTDMAITGTFTWALLAFVNLLDEPGYSRAAILGLAVGLAVLSKFSALVFLPACGLALLLWRWLAETRRAEKKAATSEFRWARGVAVAALAAFLVVWGGYRFSVGSITTVADRPHPTLDRTFGAMGAPHNVAYAVSEAHWIPAPAFFRGIAEVRQKEAQGHKGYLLGQIRLTGWWYFFPVALAVKTTLPFLLLAGAGAFCLLRSGWRERDWIAAAPVVAALALLLVSMTSHINIGIRHILPIYPLLAIAAGVGTCRLWKIAKSKYVGALLVLPLLAWHLASSARAHPDYLAYFNELAGQHPERILIDSDLDWGQDLLRLSAALRERGIEEVSIAYAGSADLDMSRFGLPRFHILAPYQRADGWIAISLLRLKTGGLGYPNDSYSWLKAYKPVCLVGRTIRLYYLPGHAEANQADSGLAGMEPHEISRLN